LWVPDQASIARQELTFSEIRDIVDQARAMGCQAWSISGGEPMLRPDFSEIFDYITRKAVHYKINTNGTLIIPEIAKLLTRPGYKMIALYGATGDVYDHVTRTPGAFDALMQGIAYMKEAGASFTVQVVPMRANIHQYDQMIELAQTFSNDIRVGASWLWLSADRSPGRNAEIKRQRLTPGQVLMVEKPDPTGFVFNAGDDPGCQSGVCGMDIRDENLFAYCIAARRDFHIDPYGGMSFCYYIKDPALRYDLRQGTFQEAWDEFIPSLATSVRADQGYYDNCGSCTMRSDCRWCPVYGYLEHGRYNAKVEYLCQVTEEYRRFKEEWKLDHLRYYQIAGITLKIGADFPLTGETFTKKYDEFQVEEPGEETIGIKLVSGVPKLSELNLGKEVYRQSPWAIYQNHNTFIYTGIRDEGDNDDPRTIVTANKDHTRLTIYRDPKLYQDQPFHSLTTLVSDQIFLAQSLAHKQALYLHSSGIILNGKGFLFVGHSGAGKSTMMKMLRGHGEILCDDRNVVRRWPDGFRVHGTWSHGELPDVSVNGAMLQGMFFLEQAPTNQRIPLTDPGEILSRLLPCVVKGLVTADWWDKILALAGQIAREVPIYRLKFDKSGQVIEVLRDLYQ
jgi:MoaA/NifB/PqqE/SkfB family radical SAM enzyme